MLGEWEVDLPELIPTSILLDLEDIPERQINILANFEVIGLARRVEKAEILFKCKLEKCWIAQKIKTKELKLTQLLFSCAWNAFLSHKDVLDGVVMWIVRSLHCKLRIQRIFNIFNFTGFVLI